MSLAAHRFAWHCPLEAAPGASRAAQRSVLLCIAEHANERGAAWPSVARMAGMTGFTVRGVRRALRALEDQGLIVPEVKPGTVTRYVIAGIGVPQRLDVADARHTDDDAGNAARGHHDRGGRTLWPEGAATMTGDPGHHDRRTPQEPLMEPQIEPAPTARQCEQPTLAIIAPASSKAQRQPSAGEPEGFAEWWAAYPRKVGKDAARRAYVAALKRASAADLLSGLKRATFDTREEGRFIPHPSTWLNGGRWQDEAGGAAPSASAALAAAPDHPWWPRLSAQISASDFRQWIARLRVIEEADDEVHLAAPAGYHASHVRTHYETTLRAMFGKRVVITSNPNKD